MALARLEQGNLSNTKTVGEGVLEYRIDWGPGYRVYFGRDGDVLVILQPSDASKRTSARQKRIGRITSGDGRARNNGGGHGPVEELQRTGATPSGG